LSSSGFGRSRSRGTVGCRSAFLEECGSGSWREWAARARATRGTALVGVAACWSGGGRWGLRSAPEGLPECGAYAVGAPGVGLDHVAVPEVAVVRSGVGLGGVAAQEPVAEEMPVDLRDSGDVQADGFATVPSRPGSVRGKCAGSLVGAR
jgi:hypothetical protein